MVLLKRLCLTTVKPSQKDNLTKRSWKGPTPTHSSEKQIPSNTNQKFSSNNTDAFDHFGKARKGHISTTVQNTRRVTYSNTNWCLHMPVFPRYANKGLLGKEHFLKSMRTEVIFLFFLLINTRTLPETWFHCWVKFITFNSCQQPCWPLPLHENMLSPLFLWWMWLFSEICSEHHSHWPFTRRWVLDRHNSPKRLLQNHTQKSRYQIYKGNRKSAEITVKWQNSRSVIRRVYWESQISLNTIISISFVQLDYFCIFVSSAVALSLMWGGINTKKQSKKKKSPQNPNSFLKASKVKLNIWNPWKTKQKTWYINLSTSKSCGLAFQLKFHDFIILIIPDLYPMANLQVQRASLFLTSK